MRAAWLALVIALAPGCRQVFGLDPPTGTIVDAAAPDALPPADDGFRSGTRLKLMWNAYGDTREYTGVYDSTLATPCQAQLWSDGNTYCTPTTASFVAYLDAACTMAVAMVRIPSGTCPAPAVKFAEVRDSTCSVQTIQHFYTVGDPLASQPFYEIQDGACAGPYTNANYALHTLPTEVMASDLVQQTTMALPGARLEQHVLAGADGSEVRTGAYDTQLATTCTPNATDGVCSPPASVGSYLDAACTTALASGIAGCLKPPFGVQPTYPGCAMPGNHYYTVGATSFDSTFYQLQYTDACMGFAAPSGTNYFGLGTEVTTVPVTTRLGSGSGPVIRSYFNDGTSDVGALGLFDTVHDTTCTTAANGQCLPTEASVAGGVTYYSDASCMNSVTLGLVSIGVVGCAVPPLPKYFISVTEPTGTCSPTYQVLTAGVKTTSVYTMNATCQPVGQSNSVFVTTTGEVPLTEFATSTAGIDP